MSYAELIERCGEDVFVSLPAGGAYVDPLLAICRFEDPTPGAWHYIYGLYDPRNGALRYIGKTDRPEERLTNQMNERSDTHRCHWLQELRSLGLRPVQQIIDAVPRGADWQTVERAYIAAMREAGEPLTNATDGGDGVVGLSPEARAKMRQTWLGRKHKPETIAKLKAARANRVMSDATRAKMSAAMTGREFTPEWRAKISAGLHKLTDDQVREIRMLLAAKVSQYVIAERFGVHQGTVSNIARGVTYRGIGLAPETSEGVGNDGR